MQETIKLDLRAIDFEGTNFANPSNCAISKAVKRIFPDVKLISTSTYYTTIDNIKYYFDKEYGYDEFLADKIRATYTKIAIRTITLIKKI